MAWDPLTAVVDLIKTTVDKVVPDANQKIQIKADIDKMQISGELGLLMKQLEINLEEAKSTNWFVAGWRPAVGWIATLSLGLVYVPKALLLATMWAIQAVAALKVGTPLPTYPDLGLTDILGLLGTMLGMGTLRTAEKIKDAEGNR